MYRNVSTNVCIHINDVIGVIFTVRIIILEEILGRHATTWGGQDRQEMTSDMSKVTEEGERARENVHKNLFSWQAMTPGRDSQELGVQRSPVVHHPQRSYRIIFWCSLAHKPIRKRSAVQTTFLSHIFSVGNSIKTVT